MNWLARLAIRTYEYVCIFIHGGNVLCKRVLTLAGTVEPGLSVTRQTVRVGNEGVKVYGRQLKLCRSEMSRLIVAPSAFLSN